jgi:hypothetical protein
MKKIRKLTSLLLVLVMSLALAVPCFAAETGPEEYGEIVDEWDDGGFHVQIIKLDEDVNRPKPRAGIMSERTYYDYHSEPFTWACSVYTSLYIDIDCSKSGCKVDFNLDLNGGQYERGTVLERDKYTVHVERNPEFSSLVACSGVLTVQPYRGASGMVCTVSADQYGPLR